MVAAALAELPLFLLLGEKASNLGTCCLSSHLFPLPVKIHLKLGPFKIIPRRVFLAFRLRSQISVYTAQNYRGRRGAVIERVHEPAGGFL